MKVKIIKKPFKELKKFAADNGYLIGVYHVSKFDNKWHLMTHCARYKDIFNNINIFCQQLGESSIDFALTNSECGKYVFMIHNNYNLKNIVEHFDILNFTEN